MAMAFLADLCESKLLPTYTHLNRFQAKQIAELLHLYLCAMNILAHEPTSREFAAQYARRTTEFGTFDLKRNFATDLYVMIHAILSDDVAFRSPLASDFFIDHMSIDLATITAFLRNIAYKRLSTPTINLLFANIDRRLHIEDSSLRAIRRLAQDWPRLNRSNKRLCITRILQILRSRASRSELLPWLEKLAREQELEIKQARDPEPKTESLLKAFETASSGASGVAGVATMNTGFDPKGWSRGIYPPPKKREKLGVIRR